MELDDGLAGAQKRLRELWGQWGLAPEPSVGDAQNASLAKVRAWLAAADRERVLRVMQLLMLNPQDPTAHRAEPARLFAEVVSGTWGTAGTRPDYVQSFQAMLLACWPSHGGSPPWDVVPLMEPVWRATHTKPEAVAAEIIRRRRTVSSPAVPYPESVSTPPVEMAPAKRRPAPGLPWLEAHKGGDYPSSGFLPHIVAALGNIEASVTREERPAELDLLWWGEAKYCHGLSQPYRRVKDAGRVQLHATAEVAGRLSTTQLGFEPTAAYLAEVVADLGFSWDKERPLREWLTEYATALGTDRKAVVGDASTAIQGSAIGLPALWLSAQLDAKAALEGVAAACHIDIDVKIDRAEWLRWLLGEFTLVRLLS